MENKYLKYKKKYLDLSQDILTYSGNSNISLEILEHTNKKKYFSLKEQMEGGSLFDTDKYTRKQTDDPTLWNYVPPSTLSNTNKYKKHQSSLANADNSTKNQFFFSLNCSDIIYYLSIYDDLYKYIDNLDGYVYRDLLLKLNIVNQYDESSSKAKYLLKSCIASNHNKLKTFKISPPSLSSPSSSSPSLSLSSSSSPSIKQKLIDYANKTNTIGNSAITAVTNNIDKLNDEQIVRILNFAKLGYLSRLSWIIELFIRDKFDDFEEMLHDRVSSNKIKTKEEISKLAKEIYISLNLPMSKS